MSYLRDDVYDWATDLDMVHGTVNAYRWGGGARDGKWLVWLGFAAGVFIAADCVVDDFGSLVPVVCRPSYGLEVQS